jgi:NTE family protein
VRQSLAAVTLALVVGCAGFEAQNHRLSAWDPSYGYRPTDLQDSRPLGSVVMLLAFSGGGTRAAAFSYGVLEELRDTQVVVRGEPRRLLDEVDLISSVSGGSFTSAYYGLYGDRIFEDFESRFLRRDIAKELTLTLLNPIDWFRMLSPSVTRTDLAIRLYDEEIFEGATFTDLDRAHGPFIQINAADLASGSRFTFFQPQFDLICSDLSQERVARAVAASSAVPVVFESITLRNYAGSCGYVTPTWLTEALADPRASRRRHAVAKVEASYLDAEERPYIHLVDGGVADNLGLRAPMETVGLIGGARRFRELGVEAPDHIVVVVVDSEVNPPPAFSLEPSPPSLGALISAITGSQINRFTFETIELMDETIQRWARELPVGADGEPTQAHVVELAFDLLESPADRAYFNALPTSFDLDDEQVDRVIAAARELMRRSPEYQGLLRALGASETCPPDASEEHCSQAAAPVQ